MPVGGAVVSPGTQRRGSRDGRSRRRRAGPPQVRIGEQRDSNQSRPTPSRVVRTSPEARTVIAGIAALTAVAAARTSAGVIGRVGPSAARSREPRLVPELDRGQRGRSQPGVRPPERAPDAVAVCNGLDERRVVRRVERRVLVALGVTAGPARRVGGDRQHLESRAAKRSASGRRCATQLKCPRLGSIVLQVKSSRTQVMPAARARAQVARSPRPRESQTVLVESADAVVGGALDGTGTPKSAAPALTTRIRAIAIAVSVGQGRPTAATVYRDAVSPCSSESVWRYGANAGLMQWAWRGSPGLERRSGSRYTRYGERGEVRGDISLCVLAVGAEDVVFEWSTVSPYP